MEGESSSDRLADVSDVVDVNLERSRDRLQRSENKRRSEKTQNSRRSRSENDDNTSDKGSRYQPSNLIYILIAEADQCN